MELLRTYMRHWLCALSLAALLAVLHGCVADDVETQRTGSMFRMTVTVITNSSMGTRANHADDHEEEGNPAEDFINMEGGDFRLVLFNKDGEYLFEVNPQDPSSLWKAQSNVDGTVYRIEGELDLRDIDPGKIDDIKDRGLQIMALANWENIGGNYNTGGLFGTTADRPKLNAVWEDGSSYNFTYTPGTGNETWCPDHEATSKKLIPMFGYAEVPMFFLRNNLGEERETMWYSEGKILMQRAMAKVEVIDKLPQEALSITDVTMTVYNGRGRFIPDVEANPDWDAIGSQVETSSLPNDPEPNSRLKFVQESVDSKKWIAYVPEMQLSEEGIRGEISADDNTRPRLDVTITGDESIEDVYTETTYPLHFARYNEVFKPTIPDESWNHILRNHIYRFYVNNVGIDAEFELHVVPWELDEDETWDYTDHVTVGEILKWRAGSYERLDDETGRLLLWIGEEDKMLEGWFQIKTPLNGRWYARLTPLDDARPNAVTFVDAYGKTMEPSSGDPPVCLEVSGIIEKESPAWIRIKPTNQGNEDMSAFKLEFFVENLGVWIRVPMVDGEGKSYQNYTIVRKGNRLP